MFDSVSICEDAHSAPPWMRSALGVIAGATFISLLLLAALITTRRISPGWFDDQGFPSQPVAVLITLGSSAVIAALGGWLTAWIGRREDLRDAWILAGWALVVNLTTGAAWFSQRPGFFFARLVVLAAILAGGWLAWRFPLPHLTPFRSWVPGPIRAIAAFLANLATAVIGAVIVESEVYRFLPRLVGTDFRREDLLSAVVSFGLGCLAWYGWRYRSAKWIGLVGILWFAQHALPI